MEHSSYLTTALLLGVKAITEVSHIHQFSKLTTSLQELRTQWLTALHRDNIADLSNIYVCMHHFHPKDIITVDRILQADGNFTERIRARPKLCEIELLFEEIENYGSHELSLNKLVTFEHHVKEALHQSKLNSLLTDPLTDDVSDLSPYLSRLHFIQCQLANVLVHKDRRKYNVITQAMALKAHLTSSSCYRYLQSLDCLCLPHVKTLQPLYSKIGL